MVVSAGNLPPLILLLMTDQFRYDALDPNITPNLSERLTGVAFEQAYSSTPTCTPARAGLLTGKSPWNHGMLGYGMYVDCPLYPTTLPSVLASIKGYETYTVGKNHFGFVESQNTSNTYPEVKKEETVANYVTHGYQHLKIYDGLTEFKDDYDMDFDRHYPGINPNNITCPETMDWNSWQACPYGMPNEADHPTAWTTREALIYLQDHFWNNNNNDHPMFLKVSYHRPHSPYDPPRRLLERELQRMETFPKRFVNKSSWDHEYHNSTAMPRDAWFGHPSDASANYIRAAYRASVAFIDEQIGELFDWLEQNQLPNSSNNLLQDALVIWTSDHGDMNGDHNLWRKGYPFQGSAHVPLTIKLPSSSGANTGTRVRRRTMDGTSHTSAASKNRPGLLETPTQRQVQQEELLTTSDALVETRDIAVTIYDYLGILDEVRLRDPLVDGMSLLGVLLDNKNNDKTQFAGSWNTSHDAVSVTGVRTWLDLEHSKVYSNRVHWNAIIGYQIAPPNDFWTTVAKAYNNNLQNKDTLWLWKYIFFAPNGTEQLFCLTHDPNETNDLSLDPTWEFMLRHWRTTLASHFLEQGRGDAWVSQDGTLVIGRKPITFGPHYPCQQQKQPEEIIGWNWNE